VRIESPVTLFTFICRGRPKIKEHRRNYARLGPDRAFEGRSIQTMLSADVYTLESTGLCETSHNTNGGSRINENHRGFQTFLHLQTVGLSRTLEISVFQVFNWPDFSPADIYNTVYRVGVQGKFKKIYEKIVYRIQETVARKWKVAVAYSADPSFAIALLRRAGTATKAKPATAKPVVWSRILRQICV